MHTNVDLFRYSKKGYKCTHSLTHILPLPPTGASVRAAHLVAGGQAARQAARAADGAGRGVHGALARRAQAAGGAPRRARVQGRATGEGEAVFLRGKRFFL